MRISRVLHTILLTLFVLQTVSAQRGGNEGFVRQTREEYIDRYHKIAIDHMERYGIPASITLAQGILESDCGNSRLSRSSNNHFGIKCKKSWTGDRVYHDDDEKGECFRAYPSVEESYEDHAEFLDNSPRYDSLFAYSSSDYRSWARGLKAAGYATAPDYAERLVKIIEANKLYLFDKDNGAALYAASHTVKEPSEEHFSVQPADNDSGVDPDNYRVTINAHKGYNVYSTNGTFYVLAKQDDTYENIGEKFQVSAANLRRFNDVDKGVNPIEGEPVYINRKQRSWSGEASTHTALEGETLYTLSQHYGITEKSLRKINSIKGDHGGFRAGDVVLLRK